MLKGLGGYITIATAVLTALASPAVLAVLPAKAAGAILFLTTIAGVLTRSPIVQRD
jgi:hypothetical protein